MFPRYEIHNPWDRREIKVPCYDLKKTGIVVYETGRRTMLAGILVLAGMSTYAHYLDTPSQVVPVVEISQQQQQQQVTKTPVK